MKYNFTVSGNVIHYAEEIILYSGNVNTYEFGLQFDEEWTGFEKFACFTKDKKTCIICIDEDLLTVPAEMLDCAGVITFGVFATSGSDEIRRISSNEIKLEVKRGAYREGTQPQPPAPDLWESLMKKSIPVIKDGYWYIYSINEGEFVNTGISASGDAPKRGADYWTDADIAEIKSYVDEAILGGEW